MKGAISPKGVLESVHLKATSIVSSIANKKDKVRILEIGPGSGALAEKITTTLRERQINFLYECGDIEPEQINNRNIGIDCLFMDAQAEFNLEHKYDLIISVELIEHIENPFHFVRQLAKSLTHDGQVLLTSPNILSLLSRMRFFFAGCTDYFRRPYNEYWLNMGHVNPINPVQLVYILRKNGFEIDNIYTASSKIESFLLIPFIPLIAIYSFIHYILREKGKVQKKRNSQLLKFLLSPALLFGKTAIYHAVRIRDIIAEPDTWHRSDNNFEK